MVNDTQTPNPPHQNWMMFLPALQRGPSKGETTYLRLETLEVLHVQFAARVEEERMRDRHIEHGVQEYGEVVCSLPMRNQQLDDVSPAPLVLPQLAACRHLLHQMSVGLLRSTHHYEWIAWLWTGDRIRSNTTTNLSHR